MKIIKHGQEARDALKRGIDLVAKSAKPTLGPAGKVAILGKLAKDFTPKVADDAVSVAMEVESNDPIENEAIKMVREALMGTSKHVKDATATTITLIEAFSTATFDKLKDNGSLAKKRINTIELKKELDTLCEEVKTKLKKKAKKVTSKELKKIALTAGTYEWIADLVSEVFSKVGKDGYVSVEEDVTTGYEVFSGLEIPAGYPSEYFINAENKECVLKGAHVFVTNNRLDDSSLNLLIKLVALVQQEKRNSLIIIAPEFSKNVLSACIATKLEADFYLVPIKLPTFDKDDVLLDIAALSNAKFFDKNVYQNLTQLQDSVSYDGLGVVQKAVIDGSKTVFIGGNGDVRERIKRLKDEIKKTSSLFDKDKLEKRLASLSGGIASIRIGGYPDSELGYYKLKLENAVASVENALRDGVVRGGGLALKEIAEEMEPNLLTEALKAPHRTIQENNGSPLEISEDVFDAVANTIGALESARSFAGSILMAETVIAYKDESKDEDEA